MPWFPGAIVKEVTRHRTLRSSDRGIVNHIAVSEGASLFNYFNQPGNPTSHFYVRYDGDVEQYVDTKYRAPAQLEGNPTLISIETQGGVVRGQTWTAAQLETLAQIAAWCSKVHGIPLIPMTSSRAIAQGVGYHRLGVDPWRVNGGELWSSAYGKTCPEDQRIDQIPGIITRARAIAAGDTEAPVTPEEMNTLAALIWSYKVGATPGESVGTIMARLNPGTAGIGSHVRDKVWDKDTTSTRDNSAIKTLDLLRQAHGDSSRTIETLSEGGPINSQLDAIHTTLTDEDAQTDRIETAVTTPLDPATIAGIATAVAAAMPPGEPVSQEALEAALRNVLGSLDS